MSELTRIIADHELCNGNEPNDVWLKSRLLDLALAHDETRRRLEAVEKDHIVDANKMVNSPTLTDRLAEALRPFLGPWSQVTREHLHEAADALAAHDAARSAPAASPPAGGWTRDVPTKPGWYWWKPESLEESPQKVFRSHHGDLEVAGCPLKIVGEWWPTPLPPPGEPGRYDERTLRAIIAQFVHGNYHHTSIACRLKSLIGQPLPAVERKP